MLSLFAALAVAAETVVAIAPAADAGRILRFPQDRSVGAVHHRPALDGTYTWSMHKDWQAAGEARGEVNVPAGSDVRLDIGKVASRDLTFLDALGRDDVQMLYLRGTDISDEQLEHVGRLTGLRLLDLGQTRITDACAAHLAGLTELQEISLDAVAVDQEGFGVGDGTMAVFAGLPHLEALNLRRTKVSDDGLAAIAGHPTLRILDLPGTKATDAGLHHLKTLPQLEYLRLGIRGEGADITDAGLTAIGALAGLTSLDLSGTKVTDAGLPHLAGLTRLEKLSLSSTKVTQSGLAHLVPLTSLQSLSFGGRINDDGATLLAALKSLRQVPENLELTERGLAALATLPHLESLSVLGDGVTDDALRHVAGMTSLKRFSFQNCPATDEGLAQLASLSNLEWLSLHRTRVTGEGFAALAHLPIKTMNLTFGGRDDVYSTERPTLQYVGRLTGLTFLQLSGGDLPATAVEDLTGLHNLEQLVIDGGLPVDDRGAFLLGGVTSLKGLSLGDAVVTDAGLVHLANLPRLEYLSLTGHFTDAGLPPLSRLKSLRRLWLSSPYLTDAGLASLTERMPALAAAQRSPYRDDLPDVSYRDGDTFRRKDAAEDRADRDTLEGGPPPGWHLAGWINAGDAEPTPESLRGKVVLIDFWGAWCGPCRAEFPKLKALHKEYADQGLVIIGIHTTSTAERMAACAAEEGLPWPIAADVDERTTEAWRVASYPSYYLIDRNGRIRFADVYKDDLWRAAKELLNEAGE